MAYNASIQVTDSKEVYSLDTIKEAKSRAVDHSTLSVAYLLSDNTQKAEKTAKKGLGSSAPKGASSGSTSFEGALSALNAQGNTTLTAAQIATLKGDLATLDAILAALQVVQKAGQHNNKALDAFRTKMQVLLKGKDLRSLFDEITKLADASGNDAFDTQWHVDLEHVSFLKVMNETAPNTKIYNEAMDFAVYVMGSKDLNQDVSNFQNALKDLHTSVNALVPGEKPTPTGQLKTMSFRALFAIMMKLMTSQENAQSRDADTGAKLSDQENAIIKNMAKSLQNYYSKVVAKASKTNISERSAELNLYKSQWDNFKDQIDGQVQNLSNAAGTTDVNNIQQTTDFEKDVLQTWGNVANQIAAL